MEPNGLNSLIFSNVAPSIHGNPIFFHHQDMGGDFFVVPTLADFALRSPRWRAHLDCPEIHSPTVLLKSQQICNRQFISEVQRRCSLDITNPTHQSLHAQITTSLTRPCCVICLHQSRDGLQRSAKCDHEVVLHLKRFCL